MTDMDLTLCERGNTLLTGDDGQMVAWLTIEGDKRLEITYTPENTPCLNTQVVIITNQQLADHINGDLQGWFARKCNCEGVNLCVDGTITTQEDDDDLFQ